jgi:hypothetical protein
MAPRPDAPVTVSIFSAHPQPIQLTLNRGQTVHIPGVALDWKPTTPSGGPAICFDNGGPSPNNYGPGTNTAQIQVGSGLVYTTTMSVTDDNPIAIQLYFFADRDSASTAHWTLLSGGAVMDSDLERPTVGIRNM